MSQHELDLNSTYKVDDYGIALSERRKTMSKDIDITMTVEGLNAPLTARAQLADIIYLQGVDMTVNGIDYTMNSQHVYRHADGTWHHTRDGERFASIYAYRTGTRNKPTTAAFKKLAKMLETIGNAFEDRYPERLEEAEYNERLDKIGERRALTDRQITVADALAVEIKALENGARQEYKAKHYSKGYKV